MTVHHRNIMGNYPPTFRDGSSPTHGGNCPSLTRDGQSRKHIIETVSQTLPHSLTSLRASNTTPSSYISNNRIKKHAGKAKDGLGDDAEYFVSKT